MDELGLFDSESTAFLDDLTDGNVITGGGLNNQGMQQQYVQAQQPQQQFQVMGGAKMQQQQQGQQGQFYDHDYGGGGGGGTAAAMGAGTMQGMQGNMTSMAGGNHQVVQQNMMSPNHVTQFGSPPPGSQNQQGNFTQYNMQQQGQQPQPQQQQMWSQGQNAQGNSFQQQQPQQQQPYMQQQQINQQQGYGTNQHIVMQQQPQPQQQQQQYVTSQPVMQRQQPFTAQVQAGQQMNGGQVQHQNYTMQQQIAPQQQMNVQPQQQINTPQQQQQVMGQQQQHYPQQQQQQFQQQQQSQPQQVYTVTSNVMSSVGGTVTVASQQNGNSIIMTPQTANAKIQQLQTQIQQLYNMPQTPDTQQQMLDLQEQVRTLRAQQQQFQIRQQQQQQQQQQQTFVIRTSTAPGMQQQQRPMQGIVIPRHQLRNIQPGQTVHIQRAGHPPQTIRIQASRAGPQQVTRMPNPQVIRQQISPGPQQQQQVVQIQQQPQQQQQVQVSQQQVVIQQQRPAGSVGQIIRVQKPGEGGVVQVQTLGATTQLVGGQQVQQVRLVQVQGQQGQKGAQQQGAPRLQIVQQKQQQGQQQGQQQKVITVLVQKPGAQKSTPGAISPATSQEMKVSMEIPSTVTNSEENESEPTKETKPKRKRPAKKRSAEQEKADKIIQEAIEKAKAEGREVPKVIETEDGQQIVIPPQKKKASPKKRRAETEKEKKDKKAKEPKEPKPKPPPKPRPPKKKKTLPTFLKNKKRSKKADSDDELKLTPPTSPLLDDAFKRRSARNTKRKKYLDEPDLQLSEEEDGDENTSHMQVAQTASAHNTDPEVEHSIIEKIMAVRIGKRPKEKDVVEQLEEVVPTKVEKVEAETEENVDVDIEGDMDVKKPEEVVEEEILPDPLMTGNYIDPDEILPDPLMTGNYVDPNEILAQVQVEKTTTKPAAAEKKADATNPKFLSPTKAKPEEEEEMIEVEEFYVKYKNFSYLHCEWRTAEELEVGDKRAGQKIKRFRIKPPTNAFDSMEDEYFNPDYVEVDRVLSKSVTEENGETVTHYLVKWRGLPYEDSTWELEADVDNTKIEAYLKASEIPAEEDREIVPRPRANEWKSYEESPVYKNDNTLREYQLEGINWLLFCWHNKRNCILADEMGLGKTIQSITFLQEVYNAGVEGPYLVIVPLSTIGNWQREFELWTDMNVIVYHGTQPSRNMLQSYEMYYRDDDGNVIPGVYRFNALVTTYEVIIQDVELLADIEWRICIIDEAHRLKNQKCKLSEGLKVFDLEHRVLLTGTPLQNNCEELFALLHFLDAKQFNSAETFMAEFGTLKSQSQVDALKELLKPMMLRRLKEDVEKTLAPKEETIVEVELTNAQKRYYRAILERNFSFLAKASTGVPSLMNTMMELRKCCNHPYLLNGAEEQIMLESGSRQEDGSINHHKAFQAMVQASGKLVLIDKLLPKLKAGNHKVLIFSQMIRVLDIIEDYLLQKQYLYERIDGRIRGNLRQEAIDRFSKKDSDRFVFLLCTRAGGLGINLTAADTVIIYDSDWNPQNDLQAQARCHRIGQSKAVKIYRLITRNSYEREMFDKASRKLGLDKAVLQSMGADKGSNPNQMSKKEVEDLLKKGAYGALMDDGEGDQFCEEDIDQILQRRTQVIKVEGGEKGSTFAKASFTASNNGNNIDIDDPNFWDKWAKDADMDVSSKGKNELIMELPRQRKQTARYTYNDGDNEGMSELESSDGDSDSDGGGGGGRRGAGKKGGGTGRRPGRRRRDEEDDGPIDGPFDYYTRADCFKVEKNLLVYGWGRWEDILKHGKHRRKLTTADVKTLTRALLFYALQQYAGDERIKSFMYDLIAPHEEGEDEERTYRNHSGLSAPVPRGRKGKKMIRGPGPSAQDEEMASKMDIDADALIVDEGYKKHLKRHANKVLLRVRLLYYLRHEVIGEHSEKVLSGTPAHEIPIPTPAADADPPAYWWNIECDRSLLVGIFKHGFEKYNLMRNDPCLVFLQRCGPPDQALVTAEMNDEEIKNPSDDEGADTDFKPKKRGRPGRKKAGASANMDDDDDASVGGTPSKNQKPVEQAEEGKHPWPTVSDLNTRLRRIITSYQRSRKHQQMRMDQLAKKNEKRQKVEQILQERERVRVESRQRWVRREESEFYRVVSSFGVERDRNTGELVWDTFRRLASLDKKYPETLTAYFAAFYHMCQVVCRRVDPDSALPPNDMAVEPISEERANRCLTRIDLLAKLRSDILWHPKLEERLQLCQPSVDMPDWWLPGIHDKELLIGAAKHGLGRTDFHIAYDPKLCFKEIIEKKQAALIAATTADAKQAAEDTKPETKPETKPTVKAEGTPVKSEPESAAPEVKTEIKTEVKTEVKEEVKMEVEEGEVVEANGEAKDVKMEEKTDVDTEDESVCGKPSSQSQDTEENTTLENGELSQSSSVAVGAHVPTPATCVYWPKDRVIMNRLEHVCHAIEHGEWPAAKRYRLLPDTDSRSSTPAAAADHYPVYDAAIATASATPVSPTSDPASSAFSFAGGLLGGSGELEVLRMLGAGLGNPEDGLKMTFTKKKRGRRSRAEIEMQRNQHLRELMAQQGHVMGMSDAESESNLSGYGFENGVDSPMRGDDSCSSMEPGEFSFKKKHGRKRKMEHMMQLPGMDGSPARKRWAHPALSVDPESRVTVINIEEGTRLAGEDAPKRKDLEAWLAKHPGFVVEGMDEVDTEDGEDDCMILPPPPPSSSSLPRPGPSRRRPRLDPTKLDPATVTGEENVAVINRETGKKITGAKAPPLKHLVQWLDKNPAFDVDAKWSHIVLAKGKIPEDMHDRILVPHRRRTSSNLPSSSSAAAAAAVAAAAAGSSVATTSDYYMAMLQSASNADPNVAAEFQKNMARCAMSGMTSGAAAFSALAAVNPTLASMLQYQAYQQAAQEKESAGSSSKSAAEKKQEAAAAEALSGMASQFMTGYNPLMLNQMMVQSQLASLYATMMQNGAQTPPKSSATSGEEPSPLPTKKHRVRDNSVPQKVRTPSATVTSAAAAASSSKHEDIMDLTVKKASAAAASASASPSVKTATVTKTPKSKKGFTLENIVQDLSSKQVKSQTSTESDEETS